MPDLNFSIEGFEVAKCSVTPAINFKLKIINPNAAEAIHSVALRTQIQLQVTHRNYTPQEKDKLRDLFGEPERWGQTLRTLLWTHVSLNVPGFSQSTVVDLTVPCTFDFNVAATKYFHGLANGHVPLCLQFSGTVFYAKGEGHLQVSPISWDKEAAVALPVRVWHEMMDTYYPGNAWLCLRRDFFERLYDYKVQNGIPTWEEALDNLLPVGETVRS